MRSPVGLAVAAALLALSAGSVTASAATAPVVSVGVSGKKAQIFAPRLVTARVTTIKVGGRKCGVSAGTPLAALAALHRIGGPVFKLRDYGACTASLTNSGSLFVTSINAVRNSGQNGWVYSVNGKAGTAGAADPSGPFGSGLIKKGDKVRWYWCQMSKKGRC